MEAKTKKKRKKHPEEFKLEAVRLLETRGERTVADVAAGLGVAESLLRSWKKRYGSAAAQVRKERGGAYCSAMVRACSQNGASLAGALFRHA